MNERPKHSQPVEFQSDISDLIQRFRKESPDTERRFGPISLRTGKHQLVYADDVLEPIRLSPSEYVVMWALMSVSRPDSNEGGFITWMDLNRILESVLRESQEKRTSTGGREALPDNWRDDSDIQDASDIVTRFVYRINKKLSERLGDKVHISAGNSPERSVNSGNRGYCLRIKS